MKFEPFPVKPKPIRRFTNLSVRITEEEEGYTVQVRLYNQNTENAAWGEEPADTLETASMMVEALAAEFSILEGHIKIDIRLQNPRAGTRH